MCVLVSQDGASDYNIRLLKESTGYYETQIYNTYADTSTITSFEVDAHLNNLNARHYVRSGVTSSSILSNSYTEITTTTLPSVGLAQYIQYKVTFDTAIVMDLNDLSYLSRVRLDYRSATGILRLSSMYYDDRIWNGVSISSGSVLDTTLLLDRNNSWTKYKSNINCMNYLNLNGIPYMGSDNGYIYQLDIGEHDTNNPINAYVLTKSYDLGTMVNEKSMDNAYFVALQAGNWNLTLDYYLSKVLTPTETFAVNLNTAALINYKIPLKVHPRFYSIQFKLYNTNASEPFDFLGLYTILRSYPR
jgi:hypothetical protein